MDIDAMVQLVVFECARDADAELRGQLAEMEAANARARAMTQQQMMLRLQALMQRRSRYESALGNMLKTSRDLSSAMISNLK